MGVGGAPTRWKHRGSSSHAMVCWGWIHGDEFGQPRVSSTNVEPTATGMGWLLVSSVNVNASLAVGRSHVAGIAWPFRWMTAMPLPVVIGWGERASTGDGT